MTGDMTQALVLGRRRSICSKVGNRPRFLFCYTQKNDGVGYPQLSAVESNAPIAVLTDLKRGLVSCADWRLKTRYRAKNKIAQRAMAAARISSMLGAKCLAGPNEKCEGRIVYEWNRTVSAARNPWSYLRHCPPINRE